MGEKMEKTKELCVIPVWKSNWNIRNKFNGSIELLRYTFTFIIAVMHFWHNNFDDAWVLEGGYIAVDFFFMLSGLYLAQSMQKRDISPYMFTYNKWKKMFPIYGTSIAVSVILQGFDSYKDVARRLILAVPDLLGVQLSGFYYPVYNTILWYVSAMLIAGFFVASIIRTKKTEFYQYIAPLFILIGYSIIYHYTGNLDATGKDGLFAIPLGLIRAVAGMCVGTLIYEVSENIKHNQYIITLRSKVYLSVIELVAVAIVLVGLVMEPHTKWDFYAIIGFFVLILFANLHGTLWSNVTDSIGRCLILFGKQYTLAVYAFSLVVDKILCNFLDVNKFGKIKSAIIYVCVLATISIFISWISDWILGFLKKEKENDTKI